MWFWTNREWVKTRRVLRVAGYIVSGQLTWKLRCDKDWHHFWHASAGELCAVVPSVYGHYAVSCSVCIVSGITKSANFQYRTLNAVCALWHSHWEVRLKMCKSFIGSDSLFPKEAVHSPALRFALSAVPHSYWWTFCSLLVKRMWRKMPWSKIYWFTVEE